MDNNRTIEFLVELLNEKPKMTALNLQNQYIAKQISVERYYKLMIKEFYKEKFINIDNIKELSKFIYHYIVKMGYMGLTDEHKDCFIQYINRRFIILKNHYEQKCKKKKYKDIYDEYDILKLDKKALRQDYTRFKKKLDIFEYLIINENIYNFLYLSYDSKARKFQGENLDSIVRFKYEYYKINNLMKFYDKLNDFINSKKDNKYILIAYEELENIFYGCRFKIIMNDLNDIVKSKEKLKVIISLMRIKDVELSCKLIIDFLENKDENIEYFNKYSNYYKIYDDLEHVINISIQQKQNNKIEYNDKYDNYYESIIYKMNYNIENIVYVDKLYKDMIEEIDELEGY
ncbi:hypothetical protein [Clostridium botulinum]|uniref:hypothetical protein n=1 Tax=Clostridium botulinum TaxID=1491 RepID=UPI001967D6EC|nr:hypothetical protein [Clostridium botulinum]MBN1057081.1 hypothetical protein [Clostridium botulinum]